LQKNPSLPNHRFHPAAFVLAVTAHLGFCVALGESLQRGVPSDAHKMRGVIVAGLYTAATTTSANHASDMADSLPPRAAEEGNLSLDDSVNTMNDFSAGVASEQREDAAILPIMAMTEPYYFHADELTEKPHLLQDIPPDKISVLPDISPRPAVARLLINEQGDIDKVVIEDSALSEKAKQFVIDSFSNVKFQPGKLGNMPVPSELRIEILLQNAIPTTVSVMR
jgi:hypothetical protein